MPTSLTREVTLATTSCCVCGVAFAIPDYMLRSAHEHAKGFYCPNGHHLRYRETEAQRLQKQLDQQKVRLSQAEADARWEREEKKRVQRSLTATKGVVTRIKNRVAHGVCPACKRTFRQLAAHMACKHPGWEQESAPGAGGEE